MTPEDDAMPRLIRKPALVKGFVCSVTIFVAVLALLSGPDCLSEPPAGAAPEPAKVEPVKSAALAPVDLDAAAKRLAEAVGGEWKVEDSGGTGTGEGDRQEDRKSVV